MAPPAKLTVTLSAVTPLFLGGAEPNERAELRPPSFKGLLRYWYRTLDGDYAKRDRVDSPTHEERFFGSTEVGQAPCLLHVDTWAEGTAPWKRNRYARSATQGGFQRDSGKSGENGIAYLGYSLTLDGNDRKAISPDRRGFAFTLEFVPNPRRDTPEVRRAWIAALWLLVHVGGVGARCRRGLGSLRIDHWDGWQERHDVPLPCQASTPEEWKSRMEAGLRTLREWFPIIPKQDHTALVPGARFLLLTQGHDTREHDTREKALGHDTWEKALDESGRRLQQFRRGVPLKDRAGFGLPIQGLHLSGSRMASPLFIRVLHLGQRYYPAFMHLPAPLPPGSATWPAGAGTVIQRFLDQQAGLGTVEVRL